MFLTRALPLATAVVVIVIVWQLVIAIFRPHVSLLPPPVIAAQEFWTLFASGELFLHTGTSLARVFSAWTITGAIAIPLGLAMGWSRRVERIVDPFVEIFRPISPLAWIPLAILWFGIGEAGKVFVVCVATLFPTLLSTIAGVKRIDPVLVHAGQVLGCTDRPPVADRPERLAELESSACFAADGLNLRPLRTGVGAGSESSVCSASSCC